MVPEDDSLNASAVFNKLNIFLLLPFLATRTRNDKLVLTTNM
jgi:hypothetical protein